MWNNNAANSFQSLVSGLKFQRRDAKTQRRRGRLAGSLRLGLEECEEGWRTEIGDELKSFLCVFASLRLCVLAFATRVLDLRT